MSYVPTLAPRPLGVTTSTTTNTLLWIALGLGLTWVVFDQDIKRWWRGRHMSEWEKKWVRDATREQKDARNRKVSRLLRAESHRLGRDLTEEESDKILTKHGL